MYDVFVLCVCDVKVVMMLKCIAVCDVWVDVFDLQTLPGLS